MKKFITLAFLLCLLPSISFAQVRTSVDIQSIQTRTYDYNERGTFRAILAVLQNNKFENLRSDSNAGLVTGNLPALMAGDTRQAALQARQQADDAPGALGDAEQVFVEALFQRAVVVCVGMGGEGLVAQAGIAGQAGIVVVGEHQHQA